MKLKICIMSAGRSHKVEENENLFRGCVWYVPEKEARIYRKAGARKVVGVKGSTPMKPIQVNKALDDYKDYDVVAVLDDDNLYIIRKEDKKVLRMKQCVRTMAKALINSPYSMAGPYSGVNTSWAPGQVKSGRVPGAMMLVKTSTELRFDSDIIGMADLDYCIQHHVEKKGVLLCGDYCLKNEWSTNEGGYQDYRTQENMQETVNSLESKWSEYGCKFWLDFDRQNPIGFRIPWKKLTQ